ncbi:MAG TPA: hypothetical protein VG269_18650 [Tepidisphaeraceae bacterium]|jgi:hypothetical protein|nr:hypothetical protein [Tepidisphaeraceae bacterium]
MSRGQRFAFWSVLITAILMGAYPPWKYTSDLKVGIVAARSERPAGYAFIADPPEPAHNQTPADKYGTLGAGVSIDGSRLFVQYAMLATITAGLFFALKHRLLPSRFLIGQKPGKSASTESPQAPPDSEKRPKPPTAAARDSSSVVWWRFRSLRAEGFKIEPTLWVFSLLGGLFIAFTDHVDAWLHGNLSSGLVTDATGSAIGGFIGVFAFSLSGSYVAWRTMRKSPMAPHVGGFIGAVLIVAAVISGKTQRDHQRQEAERQQRYTFESYGSSPAAPMHVTDASVRAPGRAHSMRLEDFMAQGRQETPVASAPPLEVNPWHWLSKADLAKLRGKGSVEGDHFRFDISNGSGWVMTDITVRVTVWSAGGRADSRVFALELTGSLEAGALHLTSRTPSYVAPLRGERWEWSIIAAYGVWVGE